MDLRRRFPSYLEWLQAHGYSCLVVYRRLPLLFHFAEFTQKKGCRDIASCKVYIKEFVSQWLDQHGAKTKTAVAIRKHTIDAECGVRQMLQLACKERVTRNRRRGPFPFESAVPGFAEYLRSERGFAESTVRNYRHSTAVGLLDQGVDVNVIRAWLGHVSLETTYRYAEISLRGKMVAVVGCLPPAQLRYHRAEVTDGEKMRNC